MTDERNPVDLSEEFLYGNNGVLPQDLQDDPEVFSGPLNSQVMSDPPATVNGTTAAGPGGAAGGTTQPSHIDTTATTRVGGQAGVGVTYSQVDRRDQPGTFSNASRIVGQRMHLPPGTPQVNQTGNTTTQYALHSTPRVEGMPPRHDYDNTIYNPISAIHGDQTGHLVDSSTWYAWNARGGAYPPQLNIHPRAPQLVSSGAFSSSYGSSRISTGARPDAA